MSRLSAPFELPAHDPLAALSGSSKAQAYSYSDYQRQRQMTLGDMLLENRIVFLQGEIHTGNANELVMKLLYLQSENRRKDVHFYLNSPGGDVVATLAIYDVMQIISCPVATYCVGQAASGAAVLLAVHELILGQYAGYQVVLLGRAYAYPVGYPLGAECIKAQTLCCKLKKTGIIPRVMIQFGSPSTALNWVMVLLIEE